MSIKSNRNRNRELKAARMTLWLCGVYDGMVSAPPFQDRHEIHLTTGLLFHACISILVALERHVDFHPIDTPAKYKWAAFTFKWITRIQPVKLTNRHSNTLLNEEITANARFAVIAALSFLNIDIDKLLQSSDGRELVYSAMYRDIIPETWSLTFSLLEKAYPAT